MTEMYANQTVIVTGVAGFVGSHLTDGLLASGARVVGVDNFLTGRASNLEQLRENPNFTFIESDVILPATNYLTNQTKIDAIFHLASPASPPRYQEHPVETYLVNSYATHQLLQYIKNVHPRAKFIFASTSEIYGEPQEHPQKEGYWGNVNPNGIRSCYDEAKRLGEAICGVHQRDFELDVRIMRIFNTYGPRMDPQDGRVIPQFISQALAHQPYTIYGDGAQTRSYCYVSDLVDGILKLGSLPGLSGITVNLGNPGEYTVKQTAEIIHQLVHPNTQPEFEFKTLPGDDPTRRQPDITLAIDKLGWQPTIDFRTGIKHTLEYFQELATY